MKTKQNDHSLNNHNETKVLEASSPQPPQNTITFSPADMQEINWILPQILRQLPQQIQSAMFDACNANKREDSLKANTATLMANAAYLELVPRGAFRGSFSLSECLIAG
jgi:hypothetical protein